MGSSKKLILIFFQGNTIGSVLSAPFQAQNDTENGTIVDDGGHGGDQSVTSIGIFATTEWSEMWIPYLILCLLRLLLAAAVIAAYFIKVGNGMDTDSVLLKL